MSDSCPLGYLFENFWSQSSDSFTILGLWVLGLAVSHINESNCKLTSPEHYFNDKSAILLGLAEIKTLHPRDKIMRKRCRMRRLQNHCSHYSHSWYVEPNEIMTIWPMSLLLDSHKYIKTVFSETTWPIELKFHMKTPYDMLAKIYANCSGHMTKMAATSIYGKTKSI